LHGARDPVRLGSIVAWLSQKEVLHVHDAVVHGGVDPSAALCALDPRLTASLPLRETRSAQLLSDAHELNRIGRLDDGTRPVKVWMRTVVALLGARPEGTPISAILKKMGCRIPPVYENRSSQASGGPVLA
jgi:hypothetical protein